MHPRPYRPSSFEYKSYFVNLLGLNWHPPIFLCQHSTWTRVLVTSSKSLLLGLLHSSVPRKFEATIPVCLVNNKIYPMPNVGYIFLRSFNKATSRHLVVTFGQERQMGRLRITWCNLYCSYSMIEMLLNGPSMLTIGNAVGNVTSTFPRPKCHTACVIIKRHICALVVYADVFIFPTAPEEYTSIWTLCWLAPTTFFLFLLEVESLATHRKTNKTRKPYTPQLQN